MPRGRTVNRLLTIAPVGIVLLAAGCHQRRAAAAPPDLAARDSIEVGYGTQDTRTVTGTISSIDGDDALRSTPRDVGDMLQGRFPGVDVKRLPGGGISVRIRGERSLLAQNEPLYVLDGIPIEAGPNGGLTDIDPHDIESIRVLKDAGSLALYGSRGANGVILITTRRDR